MKDQGAIDVNETQNEISCLPDTIYYIYNNCIQFYN